MKMKMGRQQIPFLVGIWGDCDQSEMGSTAQRFHKPGEKNEHLEVWNVKEVIGALIMKNAFCI